MPDALRPTSDEVLRAWAARVRANREQVEQVREASPTDFYAPVAGMFRSDPRRRDEPALEALRRLVRAEDAVLDIGAGGGRYALPLALETHRVIAIEPSEGMRQVLQQGMAENHIKNVSVVDARWPDVSEEQSGDVALIAHLGYDVEEIGPFLDAMEAAARRLCVAILLSQPPPSQADELWPLVHGIERAALPALPEFLAVLLARGRLFEIELTERTPQTFDQPETLLRVLRQQLWTRPGSAKDELLQSVMRERLMERDGQVALSWEPVRVGIVSWRSF